ncbi:MAG: M6 family metalloprotease domain-containing protein [Candidatus Krumholzibacteriia bacterium]
MRAARLLFAVAMVSFFMLAGHPASAVPADPQRIFNLQQPDGQAFSARLSGDETVHWYETEDGYTILRDDQGFWLYAVEDPSGSLVRSDRVVGMDAPVSDRHLRPDAALMARMAAKAASPATRLGPVTKNAITGNQDVVIILVEFADTGTGEGSDGDHDAAYFGSAADGLVLGSSGGNLADWLDEVSFGQLTLGGVVANDRWHRSDRTELYFGGDCDPGLPCDPPYDVPTMTDNCNACIPDLARNAVQMADTTGFDFSLFDGDSDGVVDHVIIVHAGHNQASLGGAVDDIWSHWGVIPGGGEPVDGIVVENYVLVSEHDAMSVLAHEFMHDLGAPDLYDYDADSDPVGRWCVMGELVEGPRPVHPCGLLKVDIDGDFTNGMSGWLTPVPLTTEGTYTVNRLDQTATQAVYVTDPAFSGQEYFLVENRSRAGYYDYSLPESGLIITHVDMAMPDGGGRFNDGTPSNSYHGAWIERPLNLVSPDGAAYSADDEEHQFTPTTVPNTNANGDVGTGDVFWGIAAEGDAMDFSYRAGPTVVSGTTSGFTEWTVDHSPYVVNADLTVADGDTLWIEPGVVVKFSGTSTSLLVNGTLIAVGTEADGIVFTSYADDEFGGDTNANGPSTGSPGQWELIDFNGADAECSFAHCRIRFGGDQYSSGAYFDGYGLFSSSIRLVGSSSLTISDTVVERTKIGEDYSNRISTTIYSATDCALEMSDCTVSDNEHRGVTARGNLVLQGCRVLRNGGEGVLSYGANTEIRNCRIADNLGSGLYVPGTGATVVADTVSGNGNWGLYLPTSPVAFNDNVVTDNAGPGLGIPAPLVTNAWLGSGVMNGNGRSDAIWVYSGTITATSTWIDEHPYVIGGDVAIADGVTLSLESGTVVKFDGVSNSLSVNGTLIANGTVTDNIIFTSVADDEFGGDTNANGPSTGSPGQWELIDFNGADAGCSLTHCRIRFGGDQYYTGASFDGYYYFSSSIRLVGSSSLTMSDTVVERTKIGEDYSNRISTTIYSATDCALEMSDCTVSDNEHRGVTARGNLVLQGCRFLRNGGEGVLSYGGGSDIRNCLAADNGNDGLNLQGASAIVLADTLLNNGDQGLLLNNLPAEFRDCIAAGNNRSAFVLPTSILTESWHSGNSVQAGDAIGVWGGDIPAGTTWIDEHPVNVYGNLILPHDHDLTLEPGSILKFDGTFGLTINGTLVAVGTEVDNIVFTSYKDDDRGGDTNGDGATAPPRGSWRNLTFTGTNPGCSLQHCQVRYAGYTHDSTYREAVVVTATGELVMTDTVIEETGGGSTYPYALRVEAGADFQVLDSAFRNNAGHGAWIAEPTALLTGCSADGNGLYGFFVHPELAGEAGSLNTNAGNSWDAVGIMAGDVTIDDSWPSTTNYAPTGMVTIAPGATVILERGATLKFNGPYSLNVNGGLYAQGDPIEKVVFTSFKDDNYGGDTNDDGVNTVPAAGDWGGINFAGAHAGSHLGWTVVAYGGASSVPAIKVDNAIFSGPFTECIVRNNLGRGVQVGTTGDLAFNNCDLYGNGYGLENLNPAVQVDARGNWWGHPSGPAGAGPGTGDAVSSYVQYEPWLSRSIDNPWVAFTSPSTSGNYTDVLVFDLDEDPLLDVVAGTESSGLEVYLRTGFEEWAPAPSPISSGQILSLDRGDFNADGHLDLLVGLPNGLRVFAGDGTAGFTEVSAPLTGPGVNDARFAFVDHDGNLDVVAASGDNGGVWVFYGNGAGYWSTGLRPTLAGTYNRIALADLDNDTWLDVVATSAEYLGIHTWYGAADSTWTAGAPLVPGSAFFGLDVGDIDKDGNYDIAAGSDQSAIGIVLYLGDGARDWTPLDGPTTTGRFGDIVLADLNNDQRLDLAASNLFEGINVWIGTSALNWNYWYHPASTNIYKAIDVYDFTLNGSLDLAGASTVHGLALWDNLTPGLFQEYYALDPQDLDFGRVAIGNCAHEDFTLTNATVDDTLRNVVVYTTNEAFTVAGVGKEVGPFDMLPGEEIALRVTYCPVAPITENEVVIVHSTQAVTHLRVKGQGVDFIEPIWSVDLTVANGLGGEGNSRTLAFGAAIGATDSLDVQSGEIGLPPLPPITVFDARFQVPGTEGSLINVHDYYNITDAFTFQWQPGDGGYPVTVTWDPEALPSGTFLIGLTEGTAVDMAMNAEYVASAGPDQLTIWTTVLSSHTYDLHQGWQLVSRPIAMNTDSLAVLFPDATSAFKFAGSYLQTDLIAAGKGYWLDMPAADTVVHTGDQVRRIELSLPAGWSLVGAPYDTYLVADIAQSPPGVIRSVYGFGVAYDLADQLLPGQGFWVDMVQAGTITMDMDAFKSAGGIDPASVSIPAAWELPLQVLPGRSDPAEAIAISCGAAAGAADGLDLEMGERALPPAPPAGIFDVRLAILGGVGVHRDLRDPGADRFTYNLTFGGTPASFPVRLAWDSSLLPAGASAILSDAAGGRLLEPVDMLGAGEALINANAAFAGGVIITVCLAGDQPDLPRVLALHGNVPNPFNPLTTFQYDLPEPARIRLEVFDVAGRLVRTLVTGQMPAGRHEAVWDGRSDSGAGVASGSYFYRLDTGRQVLTHKMLLIK